MINKVLMNKMVIPFIILLFATNLYAIDAKDVQKYFDTKISKITSLSADFTDIKNKLNSGSIKAKKGNKYRITSKDRVIVCDGKKIWNYAVKEKKVIVSTFDEARSGLSIETIFFDFLKNAEIGSFAKENANNYRNANNNGKNSLYSVAIKLSNAEKKKHKIDNLKLLIDEKMQVKFLLFSYKGDKQEIKINKLSLNPKLKDKDFILKVPQNVEQIDID